MGAIFAPKSNREGHPRAFISHNVFVIYYAQSKTQFLNTKFPFHSNFSAQVKTED